MTAKNWGETVAHFKNVSYVHNHKQLYDSEVQHGNSPVLSGVICPVCHSPWCCPVITVLVS